MAQPALTGFGANLRDGSAGESRSCRSDWPEVGKASYLIGFRNRNVFLYHRNGTYSAIIDPAGVEVEGRSGFYSHQHIHPVVTYLNP